MMTHRIKIVLSIFLSFVIVQGVTFFMENPKVLPAQVKSARAFLSNLKLPDFKPLVSLDFVSQNNSFNLPSINAPTPTNVPISQGPIGTISPTSGIFDNEPTPTGDPLITGAPTPTKKPTPTKVPKPTATPKPAAITSDTRPGNTMAEIFEEVGKRTCFPPALLRAFQYQESGPFFNYNNPSSVIKIYNTYGWWKTGAGDPCFGLGYHTQTGIVPADSVNAGVRCRNAVGNVNDLKIMGIIQISEWEEEVSRKQTIAHLPKNIDRRVLFDNALIFAYITRNRVGSPPKDCNNWPDDAVKVAAEKHHGVCVYDYGNGNAGNYCTSLLKLYKEYK